MHWRFFSALAFALLAPLGFCIGATAPVTADFSVVERLLIREGFRKKFVRELKKYYEPVDFKNVVELNVLLYLRKVDDHGVQVTSDAADRVRSFLKQNAEAFKVSVQRYGVSPEIVASLLYIESRYGNNLGKYQIASVFAHVLQLERPDILKYLKTDGVLRFSANPSDQDLAKVAPRAKIKVKWALGEMRALEKIFREKGRIAFEIRGSFAGAFGMSQFLPSSYARWSRSLKPGAPPDLTSSEDAIMSTSYYLADNGWRARSQRSQLRALLRYNRSQDYANAILKLAELARKKISNKPRCRLSRLAP